MRKFYLLCLLVIAAPSVVIAQPTLQAPAGWQINSNRLTCIYKLTNFVESVDFVEQLVAPAERLGHHPDVAIVYNRVSLSLTTHDADGLTELDFELAAEIDAIATRQDPPLYCLQ